MGLIRRAVALTAAVVIAALVTVAASACGGASTATGAATNGLEKKSPAEVLQDAAAALRSAKSVHVVATGLNRRMDARMQPGASTGTYTANGGKMEFTIIGGHGYVKAGRAALKMLAAPLAVQRHDAGRWLKVSLKDFSGFTLASLASQLTTYSGALEPKVRQATLHGRQVVVVSARSGGKVYVANTGPAYPLHAQVTGQDSGVLDFTEYGAPLHITAPSNAIDLSNQQSSPAGSARTYRAHGVSFGYPAGWQEENLPAAFGRGGGQKLWSALIAPGPGPGFIRVEEYRLNSPVPAQGIDAVVPTINSLVNNLFRQVGGSVQAGPEKITMAGMPALRYQAAYTKNGSRIGVTTVLAARGTSEYFVDCEHTSADTVKIERACNQVISTFQVGSTASRTTAATPSPHAG